MRYTRGMIALFMTAALRVSSGRSAMSRAAGGGPRVAKRAIPGHVLGLELPTDEKAAPNAPLRTPQRVMLACDAELRVFNARPAFNE